MDPNTALDNARSAHRHLRPELENDEELLTSILDRTIDEDRLGELIGHIGALVDGFGALDAWMSKGGFKPAAWAEQARSSL
jgi:hypothetical protein